MPWFRFRRRKDEQAAEAVTAPEETTAPPEELAAEEAEEQEETTPTDAAAARKRRRRGSRGGSGRRKPGTTAQADEPGNDRTAAAPDEAAPRKRTTSEKGSRSRSGQRSGGRERRRQVPRRAPLPQAKRELLISVDIGEQRVALLEDDRVAEVYLERPERRSIAGNIYVGRVDNVLPGMEAAFVEIGLEKNGFLYVDEIVVPELEGKRHGKKITDLIQRGQQILVQAVKDPMKTKGARLTTEISLPGRFLVYVPNGEGLGVSRRLEDGERTRLKEILKRIAPSTGGVIVRTAADGASADDIERDLVFLQRLWKTIQARQKLATGPELVYQEAELPLRIVRDLFAGDFVSAHVDSERTYKRIVGYLKKTSPHMIERVHRTKDKEPLFTQYGVDKEIESTLNRRVDLPSGGYLIFDYAEAFTVIDVNTGSFVGSRSKSSTQRLEDTIVKNNLEAVKEVVRQLRLRDIGGIVVIDFIDMANPKNRQAVEEAFRTELERDRTKTYVVEISPLGLVEMTRQKVTDGPREVMTRKCPTCGGDGIVVSDATVALQVERRLKALAAAGAGSRIQAYRIALHPRTLALLAGAGGARLAALEDAARRRFYLVPAEGHAHLDHFEVLAEGRRDDLAPASPVAEGAEVELKLVEIDLHDGTAGVGKLDGLDVVVAEAARLVGRKAKVTVGRVLEGTAFATLAAGEQRVAPITFESEAEKPTRAPARRKADEATAVEATSELAADDAVAGDEDVALDEIDEIDELDEPAEPDEPEAVAGEDAPAEDGEPRTPAKKRTRRGSRGGRRRKKPAAVDGEAATDGVVSADDLPADADVSPVAVDGQEAVAEPPARRAPRIHVPSGDAAAAEGAVSDDAAEGAVSDVAPGDAAAAPEEGAAGDEAVDEDDRPPTAAKKRTRRGSRGGRNRKKKPAATNGDGVSPNTDVETAAVAETATAVETLGEPVEAQANGDPDVAPVTTAEPTDGSEGGYVPMSEWIGDFDRRP